jgi:error-prone DNA polymerase
MLPVDINRSQSRYSAERGSIRMGFMQVKGLTEESAQQMVEARARFLFTSLTDFWRRTLLARAAVENLIAVGAFDSLGVNRRKLLWQLEDVIRTVSRQPAANLRLPEAKGNNLVPELPPLTELDVAGLDFTLQSASARYSVMSFYRRSLNKAKILSIGQLQGRPVGTLAKTAGIVISRQRPPTAKGMVFLVLADEEGELPVAIYPNIYRDYRLVINDSASLVIEGSLERERYMTSMLARRVWRLNDIAQLDTTPAVAATQRALLM